MIDALFAAVEFPQKKSFLDDLYGFEGDEVDALFNGIQSDYPAFNLDPEKFEGNSLINLFLLFCLSSGQLLCRDLSL